MTERDTMRWVWRGSALTVLVIGWVFIAWQNHFHITAPVVFVCLGFLAVVATIYNLWRTGASAVAGAGAEDEGDSTWAKPAGALGELEREKRTLLKAIKEAEFDHQMGKLSKHDVDDMIRSYRARAIEVFKEIERLQVGTAGSAREQIMREVRARIELEARSHKKAADPKQAGKPDGRDAKGKKKSLVVKETAPAPAAARALDAAAEAPDAAAEAPDPVADAPDLDGTVIAEPEDVAREIAAPAPAKPAVRTAIDDEVMDADSTTTAEPKRDEPAKEATP
jgi:hypothetical protein